MNKQEENIEDVITFDEVEEIVDVFITHVYHADDTVALITNKALVEYAMDKLLSDDCISVRKVDLEIDDIEYMISVTDDGEMIVQPVEYYNGKYFKDIKFAYVDMDGCVEQTTIDNLINRDVPVVLFGLDEDGDDVEDETDDEEEFQCEYCRLEKCAYCGNDKDQKTSEKYVEYSHDDDGDLHGFSASKSDGNSYFGYSFYTSDRLDTNDILNLLKEMGF